ncbi:HTH-type transcriptional regulator Hpr [Apilactobacillus kunkeei]|nr:HTH-type transcriptional regulator Hpr [Apilactobacillus kunkeei]CAI2641609.1 HTH-type transcriptional regulator Hpr [Apilactobacillus kunkeei]CAI2803054.1 HTH-type transcriptional regulator Hpr [Apilactobacillus kunkeei]
MSTIFFAYQRFSSMIDLKKYNLNKNQHRMIYLVAELNIASIGKIQKLLNISRQAFNVNLRELVERKLVNEVTSKKDKRIKTLELTEKGIELNNKVNEEQKKEIEAIFDRVNNDWEKAMIELSKEYINELDK